MAAYGGYSPRTQSPNTRAPSPHARYVSPPNQRELSTTTIVPDVRLFSAYHAGAGNTPTHFQHPQPGQHQYIQHSMAQGQHAHQMQMQQAQPSTWRQGSKSETEKAMFRSISPNSIAAAGNFASNRSQLSPVQFAPAETSTYSLPRSNQPPSRWIR